MGSPDVRNRLRQFEIVSEKDNFGERLWGYLVPPETGIMEGGDRKSDILVNPINPGDPNWRVVGTGDFNRDGHSDLLFQFTDGTLVVWFMRRLTLDRASYLEPQRPGTPDWRVAAVTDLDKDGDPDLVFQERGKGGIVPWLMNGTRLEAACWPPLDPGSGWKVVGPK